MTVNDFYKEFDALRMSSASSEDVEKYLLDKLDAIKNLKDKNDPFPVALYNELGSFYRYSGGFDNSIKYFNLAIERSMKIHGDNSPNVAVIRLNLAGTYRLSSKLEKALTEYTIASVIFKKTLGKNSYEYLSLLNNIGLLYIDLEKYDMAEKVIKEAMVELCNSLEHRTEYAISLINLSTLALKKDELDNCMNLALDAIEIYDEYPKNQRGHVASAYNNIATVHYYNKEWKDALEYFKLSMEFTEMIFGKNHEYAFLEDAIKRCEEHIKEDDGK